MLHNAVLHAIFAIALGLRNQGVRELCSNSVYSRKGTNLPKVIQIEIIFQTMAPVLFFHFDMVTTKLLLSLTHHKPS
jgi:hypothetical protein